MGEIKSTLDLALERTRKITISEKEREEIKHRETVQKAESLFHRYREGHLSLTELAKEIRKMEKSAAAHVKAVLVSQWVDRLSLSEEGERFLEGINSLKSRPMDEVTKQFRSLLSESQTARETLRRQVETEMLEVLKREGICGSAVHPRVEGSQGWKEGTARLDRLFKARLSEIQEQLRALAGMGRSSLG